jgi:putative transcription factor
MALCEMCGGEEPRLRAVLVEGTRLLLCPRCARFGTEIPQPAVARAPRSRPPPAAPTRTPPRAVPREPAEAEVDLAPDYPERIRRAREGKGWKQEELARRIQEKLSVIEKLEKGKMRPSDALVSKLERSLGVRLFERVEEEPPEERRGSRPLTLGDLIRREE